MVLSEKTSNTMGTREYCACKYRRYIFTTNAVHSTRVHTCQGHISNTIELLPMGEGVSIGRRIRDKVNKDETKQKKGLVWIDGDNELKTKECD